MSSIGSPIKSIQRPKHKPVGKLVVPSHCPYRKGAYQTAYALLSMATDKYGGCSREWLVKELARRTGKDPKRNASWNVSVVCSRKAPDDEGHRSAKSGYWVENSGEGFLRLRLQG